MTMLTKHQLLEPLSRLRAEAAIVTTMGVARPWGKYSSSELDFASADSAMGHAADLALGIALAQPQRKVICLNGDGSMLMTLGTLVTITSSGAKNLILFVVQNGTYEITGNQPIPACGKLDFCAFARGAGFGRIYYFDDPEEYARSLPEVLSGEGPVFATVVIEAGLEGPISRSEREQSLYLKPSLAEWGRIMRRALQSQEKRKGAP